MGTILTPLHQLPVPDADEVLVLGNEQIQALGEAVDPKLLPYLKGPAADRPISTPMAPGKPRLYHSLDTGAFEIDFGTGWFRINIGDSHNFPGALSTDDTFRSTKVASLLGGAIAPQRRRLITTAIYTMVPDDVSRTLVAEKETGTVTITLPANLVPVDEDDDLMAQINGLQHGAAQVILAPAVGVTLNFGEAPLRLKTAGRHASFTLLQVHQNDWHLEGPRVT